MIKTFKTAVLVIIIFVLSLFTASDMFSQTSDKEGKTIVSIEVKGNKAISTETILSKIKTKKADSYNQETLNEDLKRLYAPSISLMCR